LMGPAKWTYFYLYVIIDIYRACRRHQAAIFRKRRSRNVAGFGQHLVKLINSTACQRTIPVARRPANSHPATRLHRHDVGVMIDKPFLLYLLQCGRRLLMWWTGAPGDRQKVDGGSPSR
jgi:hypothetical protein